MKKVIAICLLFAILFVTATSYVTAHEYSKPLRWQPKINGKAYLKVSYGGLNTDSVYRDNLYAMRNAVNACSAKIQISEASPNNLHITSTTWDKWLNQYNIPSAAVAQVFAYDTNGVEVRDNATSLNSNGKIDYAVIFLNPNDNNPNAANDKYPSSESGQTQVLLHEVGHVLGLMHCTCSQTSVMKSGMSYSGPYYTSYTSHDNSCLISYYGS